MEKHIPDWLNVTRETLYMLKCYEELVNKWQRQINLVAKSEEIWHRHILDSAQLNSLISPTASILDLGSGAGFPGLVLAILGVKTITLMESDRRKTLFLKEAVRELGLKQVEIHNQRIEEPAIVTADIVTARALAPLPKLLQWVHPYLRPDAFCLFPKGKTHSIELENAREHWHFRSDIYPSKTSAEGSILKIRELAPL